MALSPSYTNTKTLKKLTLGSEVFWLKDADLRALVESFGSSVYKDVETTFNPEGANIATSKAIADYIAEKIGGIQGAMHFRGIVPRGEEPDTSDLDAIAAYYTDTLSEEPASGDVVIMQDNGKEYIYAGTKWEEVGDQNIYLTKSAAASTYVPKSMTIAGVDMADNITAAELSGPSALNLKGLSHKDTAQGTVEVADTIDDITVGKAGTYTVTGDTVAVPKTYNAIDVTPAGTVDVAAGTAVAASYEKTTGVTIAASAVGPEGTANYTPTGTVQLPSLTAGVTLQPTNVATVTDAGTEYSMTPGSVTKNSDTTAKFVKKGVKFEASDDETLVLSYVDTSDTDFYTDAVTAAGNVNYTSPTLSGSLPTFGSQAVALTTGATATANYDGNATFTGTGVVIGANVAHETTAATVTQPTFTATFTGTTKNVTPTVASTENAQAPSGQVTVGTDTVAITLKKKSATVTVQ